MKKIRQPTAIGFYPPGITALEESIQTSFSDPHGAGELPKLNKERQGRIVAGVTPHAGFIYSGPIASHIYKVLAEDGFPETFVLIGPKHGYMRFSGAALMAEGFWQTPFGKRQVDTELAHQMLTSGKAYTSPCIIESTEAHLDEHSLEVQLPFLQFLGQKHLFKIVPLVISTTNYSTCEKVGHAIALAIQRSGRDVTILASTDFTHYGKYFYNYAPVGSGPVDKVVEWVHNTDGDLINKIEKLDGKDLLNTVVKEGRTMCGASAVASMLEAAQKLGATNGKLLKYATSYDVRGSSDAIVGYAAIAIYR